jgi:hypothetical protein
MSALSIPTKPFSEELARARTRARVSGKRSLREKGRRLPGRIRNLAAERVYGISIGETVALAACLIAGVWLRLAHLTTYSLWHDELYMLITSRRPFIQGLLQQEDYSAPLYELLLRLVSHGSNQPEWVLRTPAFIAGCLCVIAGWWLARSLFGSVVAILTALFIAINPLQRAFAYEARPYTFFVLFSVLSLMFFHRLLRTGGRMNSVCYVVVSLLLVYSHYYGFLCIAAEAVFGMLALALSPETRKHARAFVLAMLFVGIGVLPALWLIFRFIEAGSPATAGIGGKSLDQWSSLVDQILATRHIAALFLIPFLAAVWPSRTAFDRYFMADANAGQSNLEQWWARRWPALLMVLWLVFGLWLLLLSARFYRPGLLVVRYLAPMSIPIVILSLAYAARAKRGALILVVGLLLYSNVTTPETMPWSNNGLQQLARYLSSSQELPEKILVTQWTYSSDYINPEEVGLAYYGFHRRALTKLDITFPKGDPRLRIPNDLVLLNPDELHSKVPVWVIAYSVFGVKVEEYLKKESIAYDSSLFGPYHLYRIRGG